MKPFFLWNWITEKTNLMVFEEITVNSGKIKLADGLGMVYSKNLIKTKRTNIIFIDNRLPLFEASVSHLP